MKLCLVKCVIFNPSWNQMFDSCPHSFYSFHSFPHPFHHIQRAKKFSLSYDFVPLSGIDHPLSSIPLIDEDKLIITCTSHHVLHIQKRKKRQQHPLQHPFYPFFHTIGVEKVSTPPPPQPLLPTHHILTLQSHHPHLRTP